MNKAYKYRIYPTKLQKELLFKTFGCVRFVYNHYLAMQSDNYKNGGSFMNRIAMNNDCNRVLKNECLWLREVDKFALTNSIYALATGYDKFFRKQGGYPKFKSKRKSRFSYTTNFSNNNIAVTEYSIKLPKVGFIKTVIHRTTPFDYKLKSATVSMERDGSFYCSVLYEYEEQILPGSIKTHIGLDYKSDGLYVDSNGNSANMPHFYRKAEKRLAKQQRKLSRTKGSKKGETASHNHLKQVHKVAKLSRHVANQRKDYLHKLSNEITNRYDLISVENLNMRGMSGSLRLGKSTLDNGYGMFLNMLEYKQFDKGHYFVKVDKMYPSSQLCSYCGYQNPVAKDLNVRTITCPHCGTVYDRDINAATNIDQEGYRILEAS